MPLATGSKLGQYEIVGLLGEGGMGAVYRARDTRLGRDVAIKVILEAFVSDRDRLARFDREARALAALNHTNVATLYGKEEVHGQHFLVMELVEGLTLASRLAAAPLPLDQVIAIAKQIAEGLEAAHEKGIVHRDLKPANVKITPDDKVKVLDFGLATATASDSGTSSVSMADSPTLTAMGTQAGLILGTASYMSPEQARGMTADHRSDIFSFGVVLYEMLTGRQPFQGDTVSDVLAAVLAREPDLSSLPPDLAPRLAELVKRCLDKNPRRRWQASGDVRHELEVVAANPRQTVDAATAASFAAALLTPQPLWRRAMPIVATAIVAGGLTLGAVLLTRSSPPPAPVSRFTIPYGENQQRASTVRPSLTISPDGRRIAYLANRQILVRELAVAFDARPLSGTTVQLGIGTPTSLVFSPDGNTIAYYETADQSIKQIAVTGGTAITVCPSAGNPNGLGWYGDVIYATVSGGIMRCPAIGGKLELAIKLDPSVTATRPQLLPDGRLLFSMVRPSASITDRWTDADVVVQRPSEDAPTVLFKGNDPRYVPSGHLVYVAGGILFARRFDPERLTVGTAVPMVEGIFRSTGTVGGGTWWYGVSDTGVLVYQPGFVGASSAQRLTIAAFNRDGKADALKIAPGPYTHPRLSPDGARLAFEADDGREVSVWVFDMASGAAARKLTDGGNDRFPVWSWDSNQVVFQSNREGDFGLFAQAADGSSAPVRLTKPEPGVSHIPQSASPDGTVLLFDEIRNNRTSLMNYARKDKTTTSLAGITSLLSTSATFSQNGRWVAYALRAEGLPLSAVFVQPYPPTGAKYQVSPAAEDGHHPAWSRDGKSLFYTPGPGTIFSWLSVNTSAPTLSFGPGPTFARNFINLPPASERPFDTAPNVQGDPVLIALTASASDPSQPERIENRVVLNWFEELRAKVK